MTTVKYFHNGMTGAPVLTGAAGTLIAILDACLVNGFGTGTVDSVVIAGGIATVTRAAGHPFETDSIAEISGATVSGGSINGAKRVLSRTSTTYTFDATGISNQTATGTISHKLAALGWAKTYSGTNLAAYKPSDVAATGCLLRVDDTGTTSARVIGYQTMSDINTGVGPFPTTAQIAGGGFWQKAQAADATVRPWLLIGDTRGFYLYVAYHAASLISVVQAFGDFQSYKSPDPYGCHLSYQSTALGSGSPGAQDYFNVTSNGGMKNMVTSRGVSGLGSSTPMGHSVLLPTANGASSYQSGQTGTNFPVYPNPADNGLLLSPMQLVETTPQQVLRGVAPGIYFVPQAVGSGVFSHREVLAGVSALPGRKLMALNANGSNGVGFIDITGPWAR